MNKSKSSGEREMLLRRVNKYIKYRQNVRESMRNEPSCVRLKQLYFKLDDKIDSLYDILD